MKLIRKSRHYNSTSAVESLEARALLSAAALTTAPLGDAADTLDQATQLGTLATVEIDGTIDQNSVDVDWYAFTLELPSEVTLTSTGGTVGLYNAATGSLNDPLAVVGNRLLAQFTVAGSDPGSLTRELAAGTYYVAVSGAGNLFFHPFLAHSGLPTVGGDYTLTLSASPLDVDAGTDPLALTADASPLGLWIGLSGELDFSPLVQITNSTGLSFPVASVREALGGTELQVIPSSPLPAGVYQAVIRDLAGDVRLTIDFSVSASAGIESGVQGNDTPATALELGSIEGAGLVQVAGVIGDDAYYQFSRANPALFAGNDVDLYHFRIHSTTAVGLQVEVFARRIGSALDAGVSLYRVAATGLVLVAGSNNSNNPIRATDGSTPLFRDPVLAHGLVAGDYYLAVSQAGNTASPSEGAAAGSGTGIYNPTVAHSGTRGWNLGEYVLNLQVSPLGSSPQVTTVSIAEGDKLAGAPTSFTVRFNEFMNLSEPALAAFQLNSQSTLDGVFIIDAQGRKYFPRFSGFNSSTFEAQFQMVDRLPAGNYELHLSGSRGVTNLAGIPLPGNSSRGDYVVRFAVARGQVGTNGNPQLWTHDPQTDVNPAAQQLGVLFPKELNSDAGVIIQRTAGGSSQANDIADEYRFTILRNRVYHIHIDGLELPAGVSLSLLDAAGNVLDVSTEDGLTLFAGLSAGDYTLRVSGWPASSARRLNYQISIREPGQNDNAPPLWAGPAPAVGLQFVGMTSNPGGGGSGPISGGSGSNPGGSNSGSGPIRGGGTGSSGVDSSRLTSSEYLPLRSGAASNSAVGADGVIIAIPTLGSNSGTYTGLIRTSSSSRAGGRERPTFSGLSSLADGPVGYDGGRLRGSGDTAVNGRRLTDLVKNALNSQVQRIADRSTPTNERNTTPKAADQFTPNDNVLDADAVTVDELSNEAQRDHAADTSQATPADRQQRGEDQDAAHDLMNVSLNISESDTAGPALDIFTSTDTVFAAGLGLLFSEMWMHQDKAPLQARRSSKSGRHTGARRAVNQTSNGQEDSVS